MFNSQPVLWETSYRVRQETLNMGIHIDGNMVKITFELEDTLNEKFRKIIATKKGLYRGAIQESIIEAINDWIKKKKDIRKKPTKKDEINTKVNN
jgi:hypothetical protein